MKLFFIEDCDYVAANSEEEAIKFYRSETGFDEQDRPELEVEEIPSEKWPEMKINTDEYEPTESGEEEQIILPFDEWLKQFDEKDLPCLVASTEC